MAKAFKKQVLGRGLSALLKDSSADITSIKDNNADKLVGHIVEIELSSINVNPFQPRSYFNEEALQELSSSIKKLGVIQPITVRKLEGNIFQLVSGERRYRASKLLGLETIPAYIRLANDQEMLEMALVENIQRIDLDPIEIALCYQRLIEEINLTQEELSERVGKKRSTVTNYMRLLKLDPIVQTGIRDGFLSMGHGRALINIEDPESQLDIYKRILKENLTVRQTEKLAQKIKEGSQETSIFNVNPIAKTDKSEIDVIAKFFKNKVVVKWSGKGKGKVIIPFTSEVEFNKLVDLCK